MDYVNIPRIKPVSKPKRAIDYPFGTKLTKMQKDEWIQTRRENIKYAEDELEYLFDQLRDVFRRISEAAEDIAKIHYS